MAGFPELSRTSSTQVDPLSLARLILRAFPLAPPTLDSQSAATPTQTDGVGCPTLPSHELHALV